MPWKMCKRLILGTSEKWYNHQIRKVLETESVKIIWDFQIQTDQKVQHSKPEIKLYVTKKTKNAG